MSLFDSQNGIQWRFFGFELVESPVCDTEIGVSVNTFVTMAEGAPDLASRSFHSPYLRG